MVSYILLSQIALKRVLLYCAKGYVLSLDHFINSILSACLAIEWVHLFIWLTEREREKYRGRDIWKHLCVCCVSRDCVTLHTASIVGVWGDVITVQGGKRISSDSSLTHTSATQWVFWTLYICLSLFHLYIIEKLKDNSNLMIFMLLTLYLKPM